STIDIYFFFLAEDVIRYRNVTGVQTCALPISKMLWAGTRSSTLPAAPMLGASKACRWTLRTRPSSNPGSGIPSGLRILGFRRIRTETPGGNVFQISGQPQSFRQLMVGALLSSYEFRQFPYRAHITSTIAFLSARALAPPHP